MNVTLKRTAAMLALALLLPVGAVEAQAPCTPPTAPADPPAIAGGNAALAANQPGPAPTAAPVHCWTGASGDAVLGARVIALDDLLVTLTDAREVVAFPPDGSEVWRLELGGASGGHLGGLTTDGDRVYVATQDGVVALDPGDGSALWTVPLETGVVAASTGADGPVVVGDALYVVFNEGGVDESVERSLVALDTGTGSSLWRYPLFPRLPAGRVAADEDIVAIWDGAGSIIALDRGSGAERWRATIEELGIAPDGLISIGAGWVVTSLSDGGVVALTAAAGEIGWKVYTDSVFTSSTTIQDGVVYVNGETAIYALDIDSGEQLWAAQLQDRESPFAYRPVPAVVDGLVIAGTTDVNVNAALVAFDAQSGEEVWRSTTEIFGAILSPIVTGGRVYADAVAINQDGGLFAFGEPSP